MNHSPLSQFLYSDDEFVPTKVLVVVAHPDDIDFGTAGTVAVFTDHGVEVEYALVTSGEAGEPAEFDAAALTEVRQAEQTAAARIVGVSQLHWLGFPDGRVEATLELRRAIVKLVRTVRPDLVITQSPERNWDSVYASHPDHLATGEAVVAALYPDARNAKSFPELLDDGLEPHSVPRLWLMAHRDHDLQVDIASSIDRKIKALLAHTSQNGDRADDLPNVINEWAAQKASAAGLDDKLVEGFLNVRTE